MSEVRTRSGPRAIMGLIPLLLLGGLVALFLLIGPAGIFPGNFPPVEDVSVQQTTLRPGFIDLVVTNGGPDPVTVAQVLVDDAYWEHEMTPSRTLGRLESGKITIPYPWVEGEPVEILLVSETGVTFEHAIEVATESPSADLGFFATFAVLGIYIGVVPVALGMTWLPFIRGLASGWLKFFLAFTAGVLIFLGVETVAEAIEQAETLPTALGGVGVVAAAGVGTFALILAASRRMTSRASVNRRLVVAYAVAAGIGLHNLGEGLAVGAAYRLGEIALGAFLVIGFAVHNTTEGLGIVSLLGDRRTALKHLLALGAVAGVPTIAGAWIGAFVFSPLLAALFLAVAAGAISQVVVEVLKVARDEGEGGLASPPALLGIAAGLAAMYLTGLLVAA